MQVTLTVTNRRISLETRETTHVGTEEVLNRDLTSVGTFDVFVPAHVAPRMSAAMLKESLSRPKYYELIWGNSMLHVSNCHIFLIRRLIL